MTYWSPSFDVFFHGNHKLIIAATIVGNKLGLYLRKSVSSSENKGRIDLGGSSITITKTGLVDKKLSLSDKIFLEPPTWYSSALVLNNLRVFVDNDGINISFHIKLNQINEPIVL